MNSLEMISDAWVKALVFIEYMSVTFFLLNVQSWWGVGLAIVLVVLFINVKELYIVSFVALSGYYSYLFGSGMLEKNGWGGAIVVGSIVLVISLGLHGSAFLPLSKEGKVND